MRDEANAKAKSTEALVATARENIVAAKAAETAAKERSAAADERSDAANAAKGAADTRAKDANDASNRHTDAANKADAATQKAKDAFATSLKEVNRLKDAINHQIKLKDEADARAGPLRSEIIALTN